MTYVTGLNIVVSLPKVIPFICHPLTPTCIAKTVNSRVFVFRGGSRILERGRALGFWKGGRGGGGGGHASDFTFRFGEKG